MISSCDQRLLAERRYMRRASCSSKNNARGRPPTERAQLLLRWLKSVPLTGVPAITDNVLNSFRGPRTLCRLVEAALPGTLVPGTRPGDTEAACITNNTRAIGIVTRHSGRRSALPTPEELYSGQYSRLCCSCCLSAEIYRDH